jgi:ribosomal protein S18 acetylase RimI-like enzyme
MRYLIRKFQEKDFNSIKKLRKEFAKEVGVKDKLSVNFVSVAMIEYLSNNDNYSMFIAEIDEKVIANALITYYKIPPSTANITGIVGYVSNVYVMKKYRSQGIGTSLMKITIQDAISKGTGKVELLASDKGINIYKRLGFKKDSEFTYMKMFI